MTPTLEYVNLFPYADGTPFDASFWDRQSKDHYIAEDPFANRDPRLYENCLVNNAEFGMDHVAEVDVRVLPMTLPVMVRHLQALPFTNTFWIKNTWRVNKTNGPICVYLKSI